MPTRIRRLLAFVAAGLAASGCADTVAPDRRPGAAADGRTARDAFADDSLANDSLSSDSLTRGTAEADTVADDALVPDTLVADTLLTESFPVDAAALDTLDLEWFAADAADDVDDAGDGAAGAAATAGPAFAGLTGAREAFASAARRVTFKILNAPKRIRANGARVHLHTLAASGGDTTRDNPRVRWASSAPGVVRVSGTGVITGRSAGTATIVAKYVWRGRTNRAAVVVRAEGATSSPPPAPPPAPGPKAGEAELPRVRLDLPVPARTGRVRSVGPGDDLQAAIDAAEYGDEVVLRAGATFVGNFVLPRKRGAGWVTIRSSAAGRLPDPGTRVTPADAPHMATLAAPNGEPAVRTAVGAHHYRLIGLEVTTVPRVRRSYGLVAFGSGGRDQTTLGAVASWLVLDRSWVHGNDALHLKRCVALNSASTAVVDSRLEACHGRGQETQVIAGWNGPGPFKIVNNYLADASEVIIFGGATSPIPGLVPADVEIRRNHIQQTPAMRGWFVKNLVELKTAERVLVEENVVEHVWTDGQIGFAFNLKSSGFCRWCVTRHVTVRGNYVADAGGGLVLTGRDVGVEREALHHVVIRGNLFERIGAERGSAGRLLQVNGSQGSMSDVVIEQNTGGARYALMLMDHEPTRRLDFRYNAFTLGAYGIKGSGASSGTETLTRYAPAASVVGNAFVGADPGAYPRHNLAPASMAAVPGAYTDGTRIGTDEGRMRAMIAAVRRGD